MPTVDLVDRDGNTTPLDASTGETLWDVLSRAGVPPTSVVPFSDGEPVSEFCRIERGYRYELVLIEGFDLRSIQRLYDQRPADRETIHTRQRVRIDAEGDVHGLRDDLDPEGLTGYVESVLLETISRYQLVQSGDSIVLGLSGELDSSALIVAMEAIRSELPPFELTAVTVRDVASPDSRSSAVDHAIDLARDLGVDHHLVDSERARDLYNLNRSVAEAFSMLTAEYPKHAWAIEDQLLTRLLEDFATTNGFDRIALGTHSNDMVTSFLDASVSGLDMGSFPEQEAGPVTYVYPTVLLSKRELYLYYVREMGDFMERMVANRWEHQPTEQSFFYYLADVLRSHWPGIEYWLVGAQHETADAVSAEYRECENCGKSARERVLERDGPDLCPLCSMLDAQRLIDPI